MRGFLAACAAFVCLPGVVQAQAALGANYNEHYEDVDYRDLEKAEASWVRIFLTMPQLDHGAAEHGVVRTTLEVGSRGYKTILSLKWPFPNRDFPKPGSAEMNQELARLDAVLPLVMGKVDILVIGNEPYIESREADRDFDLNAFYETMAARVIAYRAQKCGESCKTRLYMGALNRLDLEKNLTPSTDRWMEYVRATPEIDGVDIHPHLDSIEQSKPFLDYILPRMRAEQQFLVTEFSVVWWWKQNLTKPIPAAFAKRYGVPKNEQNWQAIKAALDQPVAKQRWDDFLAMSPWFESRKHYLRDQMKMFRDTGRLAVATYGFKQGSSMSNNFGPDKTPWLLNSVFAPRTVQANPDGSAAANYAWLEDFKALQRKPNIIVIYADDLGYGDLSSYGATTIRTPNIDRLAERGTRFVNAHAPSATCTPSRYAMLTGDYAWRASGTQILPGDAPALIRPGKFTLPLMLKKAGYETGIVGKWHLGLGNGKVDWNGEIAPGPLEVGFDHGFFMPATLDRVPTVLIENRRVVNLDPSDPIQVDYRNKVGAEPTGAEHPELLKFGADPEHSNTIVNGISRIGYMTGGKAARWNDEGLSDQLLGKAIDFVTERKKQPFFLYFAVNEPHVPRAPHPRFVGSSGLGSRGDAIVQFDWTVGTLMKKLEELGIADDTLVILSSDNGPILFDGYDDKAVERAGEHKPAGPYRSGKYSIYEGGTRVPMIVSWPGRVRERHVSKALIDHVDLVASLAELVGQPLPRDAAVDSFDMLAPLMGRSERGREFVVEDTKLMVTTGTTVASSGARILALRQGDWKLIRGSVEPHEFHGNEIGTLPKHQLYNVARDPGERENLADKMPELTAKLASMLDKLERDGRSAP
ncbi:arylsulfatase [Steroidobacter flavus]|uniref:Arylsulfatase n=1 Tax=Steroidobacter flavus TaxID=1842136 RepID=A0ABV8SLG3_9GAMM